MDGFRHKGGWGFLYLVILWQVNSWMVGSVDHVQVPPTSETLGQKYHHTPALLEPYGGPSAELHTWPMELHFHLAAGVSTNCPLLWMMKWELSKYDFVQAHTSGDKAGTCPKACTPDHHPPLPLASAKLLTRVFVFATLFTLSVLCASL